MSKIEGRECLPTRPKVKADEIPTSTAYFKRFVMVVWNALSECLMKESHRQLQLRIPSNFFKQMDEEYKRFHISAYLTEAYPHLD